LCQGNADPESCGIKYAKDDCTTNSIVSSTCFALCGTCTEFSYTTDPTGSSKSKTIIIAAAAGGLALVLLVAIAYMVSASRNRRRYIYAKFMADNDVDGMQMQGYGSEMVLDESDPFLDLSGDTITVAQQSSETHVGIDADPTTMRFAPTTSKFIAPTIRLGTAAQAATGLPGMMGIDESTIGRFLQEKVCAIVKEFTSYGSEEDQQNLRGLLDGTYRNPPNTRLRDAAYDARFPTEIYTRGCHWIPRMFA
jgi:hypothetical protein